MKIAIMQPYFMPYIGYFQLINSVDQFVVYDDIQYTKKGWINRNRILTNGEGSYISLPLKKHSDYADIRDRSLAATWRSDRKAMLNKLSSCYGKAPYFTDLYPLLEQTILHENSNLFAFTLNSLTMVLNYLKINTPIIVSSSLDIDTTLRSDKKVIEICKTIKATDYVNPIGGIELYDKDYFSESGISLHFIKTGNIHYTQFNHAFAPWLSIIDVMMFNSVNIIKNMLDDYQLI